MSRRIIGGIIGISSSLGSCVYLSQCQSAVRHELPPNSHVVVVGAGAIGISTAYTLYQRGYDVSVIDQRSGPALGTSYGNAGVISKNFGGFGLNKVAKMIKSLFIADNSGIICHWNVFTDVQFLIWGTRCLFNCLIGRSDRDEFGKVFGEYCYEKILKSDYSYRINADVREGTSMKVYTTQKSWENAHKDELTNVSFEKAVKLEPILDGLSECYGCQLNPGIAVGDCARYIETCAKNLETCGVRFFYDTEAVGLKFNNNKAISLITSKGYIKADAFVICVGSNSDKFIGLRGVVHGLKGYSLTIPSKNVPFLRDYLTFYPSNLYSSRYNDKVRFTWLGVLDSDKYSPKSEEVLQFKGLIHDLLGRHVNVENSKVWCGSRPMSSDGIPIISQGNADNVFFNMGHGMYGWRDCIGSSIILANIMQNKPPPHPLPPNTYDRLDVRRFWLSGLST